MIKTADVTKDNKGEPKDKVKRFFTGEVVSDKMDKTIVVKVVRAFSHPRISKVVRTFKKYKVHDEKNSAKQGDIVEFCECRPISKLKSMELVKIVRPGVQ